MFIVQCSWYDVRRTVYVCSVRRIHPTHTYTHTLYSRYVFIIDPLFLKESLLNSNQELSIRTQSPIPRYRRRYCVNIAYIVVLVVMSHVYFNYTSLCIYIYMFYLMAGNNYTIQLCAQLFFHN